MFLVGDTGGTKTFFAFAEQEKEKIVFSHEKTIKNSEYTSFESALKSYLKDFKIQNIKKACFGIAGPVKNNKCQATNLPWVLDGAEIAKELDIKEVHLLNDLEAGAWGIEAMTEKDMVTLNKGMPNQKGNRALISAGTGLGEAGLFFDGQTYHPFATEGGHTDFGPRDEEEMKLFHYLQKKIGHVSYERVVSGSGLYTIYRFLVDSGAEPYIETLEQELLTDVPQTIIAKKALTKEVKGCVKALEWFVSIYGAEAANLALKFLAVGGIYVGGGIAPKIIEAMKDGKFMLSFLDKGRFSKWLGTIPVKVIMNEKLPLYGCVNFLNRK